MRSLNIFDYSPPLHSSQTFRSANILRQQRKLGWETFHFISPKQVNCTVVEEEANNPHDYPNPQPTRGASRLRDNDGSLGHAARYYLDRLKSRLGAPR
jgi:hypothetical protein